MWGCFLMSGVKILHFWKDWWKSIPIHQNYTMALILDNLRVPAKTWPYLQRPPATASGLRFLPRRLLRNGTMSTTTKPLLRSFLGGFCRLFPNDDITFIEGLWSMATVAALTGCAHGTPISMTNFYNQRGATETPLLQLHRRQYIIIMYVGCSTGHYTSAMVSKTWEQYGLHM